MDTTKEAGELLPVLTWLFCPLQNAIKSWRRNFSTLTLILILPALCFIFLTQRHASGIRLSSAARYVRLHQATFYGNKHQATWDSDKSVLSVFESLFSIPFIVLSPLPIATFVCYVAVTIADHNQVEPTHSYSNYTMLDVTFTVWKRLLIISHQGYLVVLCAATLVTAVLACFAQVLAADGLVSLLGLLYQSGLVYMCMLWQSTVILNVLHETYTKMEISDSSKKITAQSEVTEDKIMWAEAIVLLTLTVLCTVIKFVSEAVYVVHEDITSWSFGRVLFGIDAALSISLFSLFALVIQAAMWDFTKLYRLEKLKPWCSLLGQGQDDHRQEEASQEDHYKGVPTTKPVEDPDEEPIPV